MFGLIPAESWNYQISDIYRGLSAAIRKRSPDGMLKIEGVGYCIPVRSARAAIVVAIKALELPAGARIGAPLYCCPVVFKAINAAGCTVRFIDVEPDTFCMSADDLKKKISQLDAVIAVHMFGNLCDMPKLISAADGKPVIEDCAQSLGSTLNGRMAGSFGDIAVFSFRSGKYLSVGEGGALFANNKEIMSRVADLVFAMPVPSRIEDSKHVIKTYIRSMLRSKPLWGLVGHHLWSIYNNSKSFSDKSPIVPGQMFRSDVAITAHRLPMLDYAIALQRANADYYSESIAIDSCLTCNEQAGAFYNRYLYPLRFSSAYERDSVAAYLFQEMISTMRPYSDITEVATAHYEYAGDCPIAEDIAKSVLVLPSYFTLSKTEPERIVRCLKAAWDEIAN